MADVPADFLLVHPPRTVPVEDVRRRLLTRVVEGRDPVAAREALERLDAGTWGACLRCGEPVEEHRLRIDPTTRFCRGCETF